MILRLFGFLFFIFGAAVAWKASKDTLPFFTGQSGKILESLWRQDVETLLNDQKIGELFLESQSVNLLVADNADAQKGFDRTEILNLFPRRPNGKYQLKIFTDYWVESDTKESGLMIQYSFYDAKSPTKLVHEISRTISESPGPTLLQSKSK